MRKLRVLPDEFHREYLLNDRLGTGSFGVVYGARRAVDDGREVAVKIVDPRAWDPFCLRRCLVDELLQRAVEQELEVMQALPSSANVVKFFFHYQAGDLVYMVMDRVRMATSRTRPHVAAKISHTLEPVLHHKAIASKVDSHVHLSDSSHLWPCRRHRIFPHPTHLCNARQCRHGRPQMFRLWRANGAVSRRVITA